VTCLRVVLPARNGMGCSVDFTCGPRWLLLINFYFDGLPKMVNDACFCPNITVPALEAFLFRIITTENAHTHTHTHTDTHTLRSRAVYINLDKGIIG